MKKIVIIMAIVFIFAVLAVGCDNNGKYPDRGNNVPSGSQVISGSSKPDGKEKNNQKALDEAIKSYIQEVEAENYSEGDYFAFAYRIINTEETSNRITVYLYGFCEWADTSGDIVSGGEIILEIALTKDNGRYIYDKDNSISHPVYPDWLLAYPDWANDSESMYNEMRAKAEEDINAFVNA